jgi:hypothetical protein
MLKVVAASGILAPVNEYVPLRPNSDAMSEQPVSAVPVANNANTTAIFRFELENL